MSLEYVDGFDHYSQADMLEKGWQNPGGTSQVGRFGGNAWGDSNTASAIRTLPQGSLSSRVIGFAFNPTGNINAVATTTNLIRLADGAATTAGTQLQFKITSGFISVARGVVGSGGTVLATATTGPQILSGLWYYVEIKVTIHPSAGSIEVHLSDGVSSTTIINISGVNTQNTANPTFDTIWLIGGPAGSGQTLYDDLYVCTLAGSVNNDFLGEFRVQTIYMAADGHSTQWTPNSGANHTNRINEIHTDDDTTYNASSTVGQLDMFVPNTLVNTGTIAGIQTNIMTRKDDVSSRSVSAVIYDGTTDFVNAVAHGLFSSYIDMIDIYETDPSTTTAWTTAKFNARQFGVKMIS